MKQSWARLTTFAAQAWAWVGKRRIAGNKALIVVGVAVAFFIQLYNCFGMATGAEDGNTRFVQTFLAPWLPRQAAPRDLITVLIYDKASFADLDLDTEVLPYARQADAVTKVAMMHPLAIFVDANYHRDLSDPEGADRLRRTIAAIRSGTLARGVAAIPVYIGEVKAPRPPRAVYATASDFFDDVPSIDHDREHAIKTFGAFRDDALKLDYQTGTLFVPDHTFDYPAYTIRQYPDAHNTPIQTAAFRLYADVCQPAALDRLTAAERQQLRCRQSDRQALERGDPAPLAVQWLTYNGNHNSDDDLMSDSAWCKSQQRGNPLTLASDVARNIYRKPARALGYTYNPCLYLRTVPLGRVLGSAANDPSVARDFTNKVVLIGSGLGDDTIVAPDQGKAPGVLLHGMALENLLIWGSDYHRWPQEIPMFGGSVSIDFFVDLLLVFLAGRVANDVEKRFAAIEKTSDHKRNRRRELLVYFVAALGVSLVLSGAALIVTYSWLHWTPINARAITLSAMAIAGIEKYRELLIEATRWSVAGIIAFLISAGLVSWLILSLFVTNDVFTPGRHDFSLIWLSALCLATWTGILIYGYRRRSAWALRSGRRYWAVLTGHWGAPKDDTDTTRKGD